MLFVRLLLLSAWIVLTFSKNFLKSLKVPGDMAQQSRALGVLGDDLGLAHSARITVMPVLESSDALLWPPQALTAQLWCKCIHVGKILC